jgi:hypothetical protein
MFTVFLVWLPVSLIVELVIIVSIDPKIVALGR